MSIFNKKNSLEESGIFNGFTDWHSHILPGVDDGVKEMEDSLSILSLYEQMGVENVWLTPHIMEDIPNTTEALKERFAELKDAYTGPIKLHLAAEYMLDSLFDERLEANDLLPLGDDGQHLLVETSYYSAPIDFNDKLNRIRQKGYFPVLAHPERYNYMDTDDYKRLLSEGVILQMNLFSMAGCYGDPPHKKAASLLKLKRQKTDPAVTGNSAGAISLTGTDLHSLSQLTRFIKNECITKNESAVLLSTLKQL